MKRSKGETVVVTNEFGTSKQLDLWSLPLSPARFLFAFATASLILISGSARIARAVDGDLDPTFGNGGKVITDFNSTEDQLSRIAIQPDGKIVAIGDTRMPTESSKYGLVRYNSNGTLDATFGNGGKVKTVIANVLENANGLFILPNGKIMIAGSIAQPGASDSSFALLRYNSDGSLDTFFGNGGIVTTNIGTYLDAIDRIALQSDGKIVAEGFTATFTGSSNQRKSDIVLARYNTDGSLDATFGNGGLVISTIDPDAADDGLALIIQPDGKLVLAGADREDFLVARYNSNGTLDTTFGINGFTRTDMNNHSNDIAFDAVLQPDGRIILAGWADQACCTPQSAFAIARYTANGLLDPTFGTLGKVVFGSGRLSSVVLQTNGKVIVLGHSGANFSLSRFSANGLLDSTFGNGGSVTTNFGGDNLGSANLAFQSDGKLVASGFSESPFFQNADFVLARYVVGTLSSGPTAGQATISGRVTTADGSPLPGVVMVLSGAQSRKTISDSNGNYHFDNVLTNGFYTVTPSRVNQSFTPADRSFSQLGNNTEAAFTGSPTGNGANPLDTPEYFVRQHYLDFLGREPDEAGFNFWSDQILVCSGDFDCIERRTINVSAAYFLSIEFQETGGLVDGLYRASYGRAPFFNEFVPDTANVARDVIVTHSDWEQQLASNKREFLDAWVQRPAFRAAYDHLSDENFLDTLISHTAVSFTASERTALLSDLSNGTLSRSEALQRIAENEGFVRAKFNEAFVRMQYFGYLRRDPDESGFHFWLNKLNEFGGNFERAEMVKAFVVSGEYRDRFVR